MPGGPEIEAIKTLASNSQVWADWSTLVVVIGLIGEIIITFSYTKDKPLSEIVLGVICGIIIALGVFGEYRYGKKAAQANAQLRLISDTKLADAEDRLGKAEGGLRTTIGEAGDAKTSADSAAKAARRATASADQIGKQADELRRRTLDLADKLSQAERAELKEHEKVVGMESWLSPRLLPMTGGPKRESWASLKPFAGTNAIIESVVDTESRCAAQQIAVLLHVANWNISRLSTSIDLEAMDGVSVLWSSVP
jgi:hypothetical protein